MKLLWFLWDLHIAFLKPLWVLQTAYGFHSDFLKSCRDFLGFYWNPIVLQNFCKTLWELQSFCENPYGVNGFLQSLRVFMGFSKNHRYSKGFCETHMAFRNPYGFHRILSKPLWDFLGFVKTPMVLTEFLWNLYGFHMLLIKTFWFLENHMLFTGFWMLCFFTYLLQSPFGILQIFCEYTYDASWGFANP